MLAAGILRYRVVIKSLTETPDGSGDPVQSWGTTFATRWAEKRTPTGSERFTGEQIVADATVEFRLRHLAGVTPKMRVEIGTDLFDILAAFDPDGRKRELVILAREVNPDG